MKNILDFFYYTKSERKACTMLILLCTLAFLLPEWLDFSPEMKLSILGNAPKPVQATFYKSSNKPRFFKKYKRFKPYAQKRDKPIRLFPFDPNQVTEAELIELGLSARTAAIWMKFTSKGGHFRKPEDVQKVFGLPRDWYPKVERFIQIAPSNFNGNNDFDKEKKDFPNFSTDRPARKAFKPCTPIDINAADTAEWQSLRGIGRVLASRIVKFRDKLGGFYALEQIRETYGLADSTFQKILPCLDLGNPVLKPLLINQASLNELASHPYIGFKAARGILNWKDQHGAFTKPEDLVEVVALESAKLERLRPYLRF
jgi:competence ComEA-like helix-hairpin-helix protein